MRIFLGAVLFCSISFVCSRSEIDLQNPVGDSADALLKNEAQKNIPQNRMDENVKTWAGDWKKYFFNITEGEDVLAFFNSTGPLVIELVSVTDKGLKAYKPGLKYNLTGDSTVTGSRDKDMLTIEIKYKEDGSGSVGSLFQVETADITLKIQTDKNAFKSDYWIVKNASMAIKYTLDGAAPVSKTLDITPKTGITPRPADTICDHKYSICAPQKIGWRCTDQLLTEQKSDLKIGENTTVLIIHKMKFQPFMKGEHRIYKDYGFMWDCEPLIPLPVTISILLSLGVGAVVLWALVMLNNVLGPSRFDDPKGKQIHIPQTE